MIQHAHGQKRRHFYTKTTKHSGVNMGEVRQAGGGKTGWGYLGYISASIETKNLTIKPFSPPPQKKMSLGSVPYIG